MLRSDCALKCDENSNLRILHGRKPAETGVENGVRIHPLDNPPVFVFHGKRPLGGPGFAGFGVALDVGSLAGPLEHNLLENCFHGASRLLGQGTADRLRRELGLGRACLICDLFENHGLHEHPVVGNSRECHGQLQRGHGNLLSHGNFRH